MLGTQYFDSQIFCLTSKILVQDVAAIKKVQSQIERFRKEMIQDGQAQRRQARKIISSATKEAQNLVETTLQVCGE